MQANPPLRRIVITGCSGAGKSTRLDELARRGHALIEEPGRRNPRDPAMQNAMP